MGRLRGWGDWGRGTADPVDKGRQRARAESPLIELASTGEIQDADPDFPVLVFVQERLRQLVAEKEELEEKSHQLLTETEELRQRLESESAENQGLLEALEMDKEGKRELGRRLAALEDRLAESQQNARSAREDSDRLHALLRKESTDRRKSESELAELRATADANREIIDELRAELKAEQTARLGFEEKSGELGSIAENVSAARKRVDELERDLAGEMAVRRSLETELESLAVQAAQAEDALRTQVKALEVSQATLEEHIADIQQELVDKRDELEAKELEVGERLGAIGSRERDLKSERADLDRRSIAMQKTQDELDENLAQLHARQQELMRLREEFEAEKDDPRVIRLDEINEHDVHENELIALLMVERRERGLAEAELGRLLERVALLEGDLARIKGQSAPVGPRGRRRR